MTSSVIIFVTCASKKEAKIIVDSLLRKRLVACGNIVSGVHSKFWWKGKLDSANECLAILKTQKEKFGKVEKEILRIHSYDVPEIIAVPIVAGNRDYLDWVRSETQCDS